MTDQPASTAPLAAGLPHIQGRCPACGTGGLFLADGGYITCSLADCPQPDAATEVIADFWEARQHAGFTFCPQNVGHVTMTAFAKKVTEKVAAVAQRASAVEYANEQKQRAEKAEQRLRAAEFTARHWKQAFLRLDNAPAAHAIACIQSALGGQTRPEQLGLDDEVHDAFRTALDEPAPAAGHAADTKEQP